MKKLVILLVLLVLAAKAFSQTITIDVKEAQSYIDIGQTDFQSVLAEPDWEEFPRATNCRYVISLTDCVSTFYKNGKFVSQVKIKFTEISEGEYVIVSQDTDIETGKLSVPTTIFLNTNESTKKFLYQYYDQLDDKTYVDVITKFTIVRPV
jgi:hypothetical protein